MNENGRNRREWVKTAAIIFLSVLLVLTFFSNTIMNYSLPEVAAQYVQSGSITAKIRGNGIIESGDPYNVMVKQTRKVQSVAVKEGDQVQKGDVLLYLEDEESTELKTAQDKLEAAQQAYDLALLSADVNAGAISGANSNTSTASYRQQITDAQNAVKKAQAEVDALQEDYDELGAKIVLNTSETPDVEDEEKALENAKTAKENADFALTEAKNRLSAIEAQLEYAGSVSSGDSDDQATIDSLTAQKAEAQLAVISAQAAANDAQLAYDRAKTALDNKKDKEDNAGSIASLTHEQNKVKVNLDEAKKTLTEKQTALTELTNDINKTLNLESLYKAVTDAKEEVDKELEKSVDAVVTAEISGTVTRINAVAGKEVSAAEAVAVLQPEGKGYTMSFSVTNDQAKRLSVGDVADIVNSWRYEDVKVTLSGIKPDTADPGQKKLLTFDVTGSVTPGQSLSISVGQKSANYDLIVPNSAIREDNNGKFVLIVESKSSPLGNRYVATRVDVEVLASDDTQSAVRGGLYGYEFVITTSTQPVEAGKLVRLSNNN
ncbi:MAG: HlyD family efflux transporter periplasmic adaptor subunit [Lachnospiraceae bacterium]|nr:HlyD family efflux transporter periplasmic adaptor subunit [Lachnospiraceae bacterium]